MKQGGVPSVTFQLVILFAAVLALALILSVGVRYAEQRESLSVLESIRIAERVATIVSLMDSTPPAERADLASYFNSSTIRVAWDAESRIVPATEPSDENRRLADILAALPGTADAELHVLHRPIRTTASVAGIEEPLPETVERVADELVTGPRFLISARLSDGTWVNIAAAYAESLEFWSAREAVIAAGVVIAIVALSIWAIGRLTRPFKRFAEAAQRLGTDVNAPPLDEKGPAEVRMAVDAFNEMQTRIRRFVEDRTQMLAAISHDLRTPITRARLRAEFVDDDDERRRMLVDFDDMEHMIASVLDFAKADADAEPTERVDIPAMLQRICDDMSDAGHDSVLTTDYPLTLACRPLAMRRCLTNLIENAVKYGKRARVSFERRDGELAIHIDDDGPGIPEDMREQAFQPFDRLAHSRSRDGGGSGLGLTVARTIARAHGGDVVLENRAGGGLRATVRLPLPA